MKNTKNQRVKSLSVKILSVISMLLILFGAFKSVFKINRAPSDGWVEFNGVWVEQLPWEIQPTMPTFLEICLMVAVIVLTIISAILVFRLTHDANAKWTTIFLVMILLVSALAINTLNRDGALIKSYNLNKNTQLFNGAAWISLLEVAMYAISLVFVKKKKKIFFPIAGAISGIKFLLLLVYRINVYYNSGIGFFSPTQMGMYNATFLIVAFDIAEIIGAIVLLSLLIIMVNSMGRVWENTTFIRKARATSVEMRLVEIKSRLTSGEISNEEYAQLRIEILRSI